jgi:hypothetical protein
VGPPGINVHDWEVCHRESGITVLSRCPDTLDQIVYVCFSNVPPPPTLSSHVISFLICHSHVELSFHPVNFFFMFKTLFGILSSFIPKMRPYDLILLPVNFIEIIKWGDYAVK